MVTVANSPSTLVAKISSAVTTRVSYDDPLHERKNIGFLIIDFNGHSISPFVRVLDLRRMCGQRRHRMRPDPAFGVQPTAPDGARWCPLKERRELYPQQGVGALFTAACASDGRFPCGIRRERELPSKSLRLNGMITGRTDQRGLTGVVPAFGVSALTAMALTAETCNRQAARRFRVFAAFFADADLSLAKRFADACPPSLPPFREEA
jgi:hypothetical protein